MTQTRFLIVEDDIESCKILGIVLAEYQLTIAHTIASATPHLHNHHFDIFMLDNWLPDGSGIEFCREIRARHPDAPIIFTSAAAQSKSIDEATEAGATHYLIKPFDPFELKEIVKELMATKRPAVSAG